MSRGLEYLAGGGVGLVLLGIGAAGGWWAAGRAAGRAREGTADTEESRRRSEAAAEAERLQALRAAAASEQELNLRLLTSPGEQSGSDLHDAMLTRLVAEAPAFSSGHETVLSAARVAIRRYNSAGPDERNHEATGAGATLLQAVTVIRQAEVGPRPWLHADEAVLQAVIEERRLGITGPPAGELDLVWRGKDLPGQDLDAMGEVDGLVLGHDRLEDPSLDPGWIGSDHPDDDVGAGGAGERGPGS